MDSIIFAFATVPVPMIYAVYQHQHFPCTLLHSSNRLYRRRGVLNSDPVSVSRRCPALPSATAGLTNSMPPRDVIYTVGDFMTKKEDLHVVKTTTTVEEALETLVEKRITGFPVIDDDWKLVGVVSDYDLLALDSISVLGKYARASFLSFNEIQRLLGKTNGKVVGDLMTPVPLCS